LPNLLQTIFSRTKLALGSLLLSALVIAVGGLIFFGWLTEEMSEGDTRGFDEAVRTFVNQHSSPLLTSVMQIASFLGSTVFLTIFGIGVFIIFWLFKWRRAAILLVITMAGASILLFTLKNVFRRARPEPFFDTLLPTSYSYPSGHSLLSFCFYGALGAILARRVKRKLHRFVILICAALLISLIGFSRIYLGVHYPSDVVSGFTAALVWTIAVAVADQILRYRKSNGRERE
jgi:undecaprenyl-diphosphatase